MATTSPFTPKTLTFLRALRRHNDREWFRARKADYERHVREPMLALIARLAGDLPAFAPEAIADPRVSMYRIYRDTRFSADKTPLKTHVAAHFPWRGFPRHDGAGLYVELSPAGAWMGGGLYMPSPADLGAIRQHVAARHPALHRIVQGAAFRRAVGELTGERLARMPRGYAADHPAAPYLQFKQFLAGRECDPAFACGRRFYPTLLETFRAIAPLVRFLNTALREPLPDAAAPLAAGGRRGRPSAAGRTPAPPSADRPVPEPMW